MLRHGHLLISVLEQWAVEHQLQKIWLTTGAVMDKARNFYDSKGNVETDQYFMSVDPPYEVVRIEKVLAPAVDKNAAL